MLKANYLTTCFYCKAKMEKPEVIYHVIEEAYCCTECMWNQDKINELIEIVNPPTYTIKPYTNITKIQEGK